MTAEPGDHRRIGVVGPTSAGDRLEAADAEAVAGEPARVLSADPDVVVAAGEAALLSVARERPDAPILPVDAGPGVRSVPELDAAAADGLIAGDWETDEHPLLRVEVGDATALALLDAMAVTAEPAHISEYAVTTGGERVARFRADGVVVATPAGTRGYARNAGAPVVPPGTGVLGIVPVAGFATTLDHWVVPAAEVTVEIVRDEAIVEVMADDRTVGTASVGETAAITPAGSVRMVRLPGARSPFERSRRGRPAEGGGEGNERLEKL